MGNEILPGGDCAFALGERQLRIGCAEGLVKVKPAETVLFHLLKNMLLVPPAGF